MTNKPKKKTSMDSFKEVHIPHIRTHVHFMDMSKLQGVEIDGRPGYTTVFKISPHRIDIAVFFEDIENFLKVHNNFPILAHELVHVLQYICDETGIDFAEEKEHGAYIMSYLLEQLLEQKVEERY